MDITNKILNSMENNNKDWINDIPNYNLKPTYGKIINNLLVYGFKLRKNIQSVKPDFLRDLGF